MKRYETYKDSGIQWVGEIPSHWEIVKLRYTGTFENGLTYSTGDIVEDDGILVLRSSNIQNEHITFDDCVYVNSVPKELMVSKGDIIICSRNGSAALIGKCAIIEDDVKASFGAFMMRYRANINYKFAFYLFLSAVANYRGLFSTSTINQLTMSIINQMQVALPSDTEQKNIAAYLDRKVSQIDATIAEKEQMLEDLKAYRSVIISEAVTKGLDKNVEMKDSGIEWMGEIPSHWDIVKTSYLFDDIGSGTTPNTNDDSLYDADNGINWLQTGDLNDGHITKTSKKISQKAIEGNSTLRLYPVNSLVIALYGATIGKVGVLDIETTTNQACCVLPPSDKVLTDYAYYVFIASKKALLNLASGGGQPNISQAIIKNHRIPYPSYVEQQAITTYLDNKVEQIDKTLLELESQIHELKSYKSTLITEVVTGKIDLRDWKPKEENF